MTATELLERNEAYWAAFEAEHRNDPLPEPLRSLVARTWALMEPGIPGADGFIGYAYG